MVCAAMFSLAASSVPTHEQQQLAATVPQLAQKVLQFSNCAWNTGLVDAGILPVVRVLCVGQQCAFTLTSSHQQLAFYWEHESIANEWSSWLVRAAAVDNCSLAVSQAVEMLRQVASRLARQGYRSISTTAARLEGEAAPAGVKEFTEAWQKSAPSTLSLPELPTNFLPPEQSGESAVDGERFAVNFYTPHGVVSQSKVWIRSDRCSLSSLVRRRGAPSGVSGQPMHA